MDADLYNQMLAMGNDAGKPQAPAGDARPTPVHTASSPASSDSSRNLSINQSFLATSSAVPSALRGVRRGGGGPAGQGASHSDDDAKYSDLESRYTALCTRAVAAGMNPAMAMTCDQTYKGLVKAHRTIRGFPVTYAQLELSIVSCQADFEYLEGQRADNSVSLVGGYVGGGYSGYGGGYGFMGPMGYGGYGGFGM